MNGIIFTISSLKNKKKQLRSQTRVGNGISVQKNSRNRLERFTLFRGRKYSFFQLPRHSEVHGRVNSVSWNGTEWMGIMGKISFTKQLKQHNKMTCLPQK